MKNKVNIFRKITLLLLSLVTAGLIISCEDAFRDDLPNSNSKTDTVLPVADFSYTADVDDFTKIYFTDLSIESNEYLWNFGGGATSTEQDPTYTFSGEGTFPVTFTSSDSNGASDSKTIDVVVVEPEEPEALIPEILEPGFDNGNDSRDVWRNADLGGVIQITSSGGYYEGSNAAKLPDPGSDRIGYQEIGEFTTDTDYVLTFKYRFKDDQADNGILNVLMLKPTNDSDDIEANTVAVVSYSEAVAGVDELLTGTLTFNSGSNTSLAIFFYNEFDESYIDSFEIDVQD
jgi:PKD repeat protein